MLIDAPQRVEVGGLEVPNGEGHGAIVAGNGALGIRRTSLGEALSKAAPGGAASKTGDRSRVLVGARLELREYPGFPQVIQDGAIGKDELGPLPLASAPASDVP
jgi:hypothetical protein